MQRLKIGPRKETEETWTIETKLRRNSRSESHDYYPIEAWTIEMKLLRNSRNEYLLSWCQLVDTLVELCS